MAVLAAVMFHEQLSQSFLFEIQWCLVLDCAIARLDLHFQTPVVLLL